MLMLVVIVAFALEVLLNPHGLGIHRWDHSWHHGLGVDRKGFLVC
jgi:hypothetical protein